MPPKNIPETDGIYYARCHDGEYRELGRLGYLPEVDIESESENDIPATVTMTSSDFTATANCDWRLIWRLLTKSNNWRKHHGIPMIRRTQKINHPKSK